MLPPCSHQMIIQTVQDSHILCHWQWAFQSGPIHCAGSGNCPAISVQTVSSCVLVTLYPPFCLPACIVAERCDVQHWSSLLFWSLQTVCDM